jgi:hypothetical protein
MIAFEIPDEISTHYHDNSQNGQYTYPARAGDQLTGHNRSIFHGLNFLLAFSPHFDMSFAAIYFTVIFLYIL